MNKDRNKYVYFGANNTEEAILFPVCAIFPLVTYRFATAVNENVRSIPPSCECETTLIENLRCHVTF